MFAIPAAAEPLAEKFQEAFTRPTFQRFVLLMTGLIVTLGRRATPILMGLFTAVGLIWNQLSPSVAKELLSQTPCYRKQRMTFSDVLCLVRREIWSNGLLQHHLPGQCDNWLNGLPETLRNSLLTQLAAA